MIHQRNRFDVFDYGGRFIDSFYSGLKGSVLAVHDNYIFALERDEKDNLFLGKYRIVDPIRQDSQQGRRSLEVHPGPGYLVNINKI